MPEYLWTSEPYRDARGRSPVDKFLRELPKRVAAAVIHDLNTVRRFGVENLGDKWVKYLGDKIWEVRTTSDRHVVRILFSVVTGRNGRTMLLLVGFTKDTKKTPPEEIKRAKKRLADWLSRHDQSP